MDLSSIAPSAAREISEKAKEQGVIMLGATVSGGQPKAVKGTLAIMGGGPQDVFEEVKDILAIVGESIIRVGEIRSGNTTKLTNQIIVSLIQFYEKLAQTEVRKAETKGKKIYYGKSV